MTIRTIPVWTKSQTKKVAGIVKHARGVCKGRNENVSANSKKHAEPMQATVLVCDTLEDWLRPECGSYRALSVPRAQAWDDMQFHIDRIAKSGAFNGNEQSIQEDVLVSRTGHMDLAEKAQRLVDRATRAGLPVELGVVLQKDYEQIGAVMAKMVPNAQMKIKLDIMGESGCPRWHRDNYIARTVVSYNSCGTEYIDHKHVDFWELENCGNNDCIIQDKSKICSANLGEFFFMKGQKFPSEANGLVHRSPEKCYHANGEIVNRLLLKVDLL